MIIYDRTDYLHLNLKNWPLMTIESFLVRMTTLRDRARGGGEERETTKLASVVGNNEKASNCNKRAKLIHPSHDTAIKGSKRG